MNNLSHNTHYAHKRSTDTDILSLQDILSILFNGWKIITGITSIFLLFALLYVFIKSPVYRAESLIQITPKSQSSMSMESVLSGGLSESLTIKSEVDILQSRKIIGRVVDTLKLASRKNHTQHEQKITEIVENTKIISKPTSYTVQVQYYNTNPEFASKVANTIVDEYMKEQLEAKFDSVRRVNEWLNTRVKDLKNKLKESEKAVQKFKTEHDIVQASRGTIDEQQMSDLNTQLIITSSDRAQAEAKLESALKTSKSTKGVSGDSSSEILKSPIIQRLKEKESEALRSKADLETRYGAKHPKIINVNAELQDIQDSINSEITNIISSLRSDVDIAKAKEKNLQQQIEKVKGKLNVTNKVRVQLAELMREAEANRATYEAFLSRFKEMSQSQDYAQPVARIISRANEPINPAYPRKKLVLALAIILGGMLGCGTVLILHCFDFGIETSRDIEKITDTPVIGLLPEIKYEKIADYCLDKKQSRYTESLRSILTFLQIPKDGSKKVKSILITSSMMREGKTLTAVSLARLHASSGKKVLLIDADMRLSYVEKLFDAKVKYGLEDYLTKDIDPDKIINTDKKTRLDFIASRDNNAESQVLLSSPKMQKLINDAKDYYDMVITDSPPVGIISDALVLSYNADAVLYVVKANQTKKSLFKNTLGQLHLNKVSLTGIIMNSVKYDKRSHYYKGYNDYYRDED